ncbi:MAG: hypothetical protein GC156_10265 [Actinomycetales bacterium]|nr:hypothetical protein [Actinomycetales bacterium]
MGMLHTQIATSVRIPDAAARNRAITETYVSLSRALAGILGSRDANWLHFGAWASASAGVVIRGEGHAPRAVMDTVLVGNSAIIADIGPRFVRFLDLVDGGQAGRELDQYVAEDPLLAETAELADAFACYARLAAPDGATTTARQRAQLMLRANVQIAFHEQRCADPIIDDAVPGGALLGALTSQAIQFHLPDATLRVSRDVPRPAYLRGRQWPDDLVTLEDEHLARLASAYGQDDDSTRASNATDWQDLQERMGFIFCLLRAYQQDPSIRENPLER